MTFTLTQEGQRSWNKNCLSVVRESGDSDNILVSIHGLGDDPDLGETITLSVADLLNLSRALAIHASQKLPPKPTNPHHD